jgi:hypothetical protein
MGCVVTTATRRLRRGRGAPITRGEGPLWRASGRSAHEPSTFRNDAFPLRFLAAIGRHRQLCFSRISAIFA